MALFSFRLQRLLKYRCSQSEEDQKELVRRRWRLAEEASKTARLEAELGYAAEQWRKQSRAAELNLHLLELSSEYFRWVNRSLGEQRELEFESSRLVEEQEETAYRSWRRRRVLELLQERARGEHGRQEKLKERRFLDEVTLYSFNRRD
ncbi:MAG: hypothetical protein KGZ32_00875 [Dethiobacter sp.]|jgi:flagellar export protein FliJ|nr:hypothetical protein [Dethiobacter sp.]